mgnify:CR=1 FL=1
MSEDPAGQPFFVGRVGGFFLILAWGRTALTARNQNRELGFGSVPDSAEAQY